MNLAHGPNRTESPPSACPELKPELNVVLVYEDFEMGTEGKRVFDLLAKESGGEDAARLTVWRFDFFHTPQLTLALSRQAEEADVIIVAPRDPNCLPPQVKRWLEEWPPRRRRSTGALVSIFPLNTASSRSSDAALLLWRAAERAGMEFFCRPGNTPEERHSATRSASSAPPTIARTFRPQS